VEAAPRVSPPEPTERPVVDGWLSGLLAGQDYLIAGLSDAWKVSRRHHPPVLECVYPRRTQSVSCTGEECSLRCAHCGGHFLKGMTPLSSLLSGRRSGEGRSSDQVPRSYLISGGCDLSGRIPLPSREELCALKNRGRLNLHIGLATEEDMARLAGVADCVSMDLVGDDATVREVMGLPSTSDDFFSTYRRLQRVTRVVPHVCLGLRGGRFSGEYRVLDFLRNAGAPAVVFLVLWPVPGTLFAGLEPPCLREVASYLARARGELPHTPLYLGCMRPPGRYRVQLDLLAVAAGINGMVQPTRPARELAALRGLELRRWEECCVFSLPGLREEAGERREVRG